MGTLKRISEPGPSILSLGEIKTHLRLDGADHDALVAGYGRAAQDLIEGMTGRPLITATWEWVVDGFSSAAWITLPMPAQTVEAITYIDADGASQVLASSSYVLVGDRIFSAYHTTWPSTRREAGAVVVRFTSGFGPNWNDVPESLRMAALILVRQWYDLGSVGEEAPAAVTALVSPYRLLQAGAA